VERGRLGCWCSRWLYEEEAIVRTAFAAPLPKVPAWCAAQAGRAQVAGDALLLALFASCELVVWVQPRGAPDAALLHQLRALQAGRPRLWGWGR